jgi:hypothetical protein
MNRVERQSIPMAHRLSLPIGNIKPEDIEPALQKGCDQLAIELKEKFGAESRVEVEELLLQYEAIGNTRTELKVFQKEICVRLRFARGAKVIFAWNRSKPDQVDLSLDSSSRLEDWAFQGLFAVPAVIALVAYLSVATPTGGFGSAFVVLLLYMPVLAVLSLPYFVFRFLMRAKNNDVLEVVEATIRAKIGE